MKRIRGIGGFRSRLFRWIAGVLVVVAQGASAQVPTPVGAAGHVSPGEFADYTLLYDLDIPNNLGTGPTGSPPYTTDNSGSVTSGSFDRIAYYMELNDGSGSRFIWVSMDAFTSDPTKIGVPTQASGAVFQQTVDNMNVESNVPGIVTGTGITTGNIEFWPYNYYPNVVLLGIGGNSSIYDFNDQILVATLGYGSMQIHNWGAGQTLLAYNDWGGNPTLPFDDVGIGNNALVNSFDGRVNPDWTFSRNTDNYFVKILRVYVHVDCSAAGQAGTGSCNQPPVADAGPDQTVEATDPATAVTLDGSGSSDPDGDALTYSWSANGTVIAAFSASPTAQVSLGLGSHTYALTVDDGRGGSTSDEVEVKVVDTTPPAVTAPANVIAEAAGPQTAVAIGTATATDAVGVVSLTNNAPASFPLGITTVTWTAKDAAGNTGTATQTVTVKDTTPPTIVLNGEASLRVVYQSTYTEAGATLTDLCDPHPVLTITGAVNTGAAGVYTLTYQGKDASGNASAAVTRTVEVYKTPTQRLGDLIAQINSLVASGAIPAGNGTAFIASLNAAQASLSAGNTADALSELNAFINKVKAQSGKKVSAMLADQLSASVQQIIAQLGGSAKLAADVQPAGFALNQNYPNPFNPSTTISYDLAEAAEVRLTIYNVMGQQVRELVAQAQEPGRYEVQWDGRDGGGQLVANGLYLYRLQAGDQIAVQKMLFAK